eukprot:4841773-Pyramimonas_sp.AAC.1
MRTALDYTAACDKCEIKVTVDSEAVRRSILENTRHVETYIRNQPGGLIVMSRVPGTQLAVGDVLTNSDMLPDLSKFQDRTLPFEA